MLDVARQSERTQVFQLNFSPGREKKAFPAEKVSEKLKLDML